MSLSRERNIIEKILVNKTFHLASIQFSACLRDIVWTFCNFWVKIAVDKWMLSIATGALKNPFDVILQCNSKIYVNFHCRILQSWVGWSGLHQWVHRNRRSNLRKHTYIYQYIHERYLHMCGKLCFQCPQRVLHFVYKSLQTMFKA